MKIKNNYKIQIIIALSIVLLYAFSSGRYVKDDDGVVFEINKYRMKVQVCTESTMRVLYFPSDSLLTRQSLIVAPEIWKHVDFEVKKRNGYVTITTSKLQAKVILATGEISFFDAQNNLLVKEKTGGGKQLKSETINEKKTFAVTQEFEPDSTEALYGLGQHQNRWLDLKNKELELFQKNREVFIPFLVSSKKYGILWDNYSYTKFGLVDAFKPLLPEMITDKNGNQGKFTVSYFGDLAFQNPIIPSKQTDSLSTLIPGDINKSVRSAVWEGNLKVSQTGIYHLRLKCSGAVRCWINDSLYSNFENNLNSTDNISIGFQASKSYKVKFEFCRLPNNYGSQLFLYYRQAGRNEPLNIWSASGNSIDYYFIAGNSMDEVIAGYRQATGRATMPPKYALGFWQCRERYRTQKEITDVVNEFRKRKIPLDVIVQDWHYWKDTEWGSHIFDSSRFANPSEMIMKIHNQNVNYMISVWPKFYASTENFKELVKNDLVFKGKLDQHEKDFLGYEYTFYDAFNPKAREVYWQQIKRKLFDIGVDAWWLDADEPEFGYSPEGLAENMNPNYLGTGSQFLNLYPMLHCKGVYENQRKSDSSKRVSILSRSAFAGSQAYGTTVWSGDINATWNVFQTQIPSGLSLSLSGVPYWTTDIGGFNVAYPGGNRNEEYRELFTRWYQFGAFCPIFRVHGTGTPREMWFFGDTTQKAYQSQLKFNKLRYSLMPYLYSLSGMTTHNHYTLMRALIMDFGSDKKVYNIQDQYMFGPSFLVNPVTMYKATSRNVYLPKHAGWYDFWTNKFFTGGQNIDAPAPYETMPLFIKAGSIIPFGPDIQYATEKPAGPITIRIYKGDNGTFSLYEDENSNYNYEKGKYSWIPFNWNEASKTLTIGKRIGEFEGMLRSRSFNIDIISPDMNDTAGRKPSQIINYTGEKVEVKM